ncbi:hypothetical protein [Marinobacter shengliensis]|uniref:hypothetical protein n=1 Tax=Marinobacter shengliensis TaxID=1389223 RepID=UPI0035B94694
MEKASTKRICSTLQFLSAGTFALLLIGCGGGGSGGEKSSTGEKQPIQPPTLENTYYAVDEGVQTRLAGNLHGAEIENYALEVDIDLTVSASPDDTGLILTAPFVNAPRLVNLLVTFNTNGAIYERSLAIQIRNTSARELEEKTRLIMNDASSLLSLGQDLALYHFSVDTAYLYGLIPHSEKLRLLDEFSPESSPVYSQLQTQLDGLSTAFSDYEKGVVADSELEQQIDVIDALAAEHGEYGVHKLNDVSDFSEAVIPALTYGTLKFSEDAGFFSRFVGTNDYGSWQDGEFSLNESYAPIASLIRTNLQQDIRCDAF